MPSPAARPPGWETAAPHRAVGTFVAAVLALSWIQFARVSDAVRDVVLLDGAILTVAGFLSPLWALIALGALGVDVRELGARLREATRLRAGAGARATAGLYAAAVVGPAAAVATGALLVPGIAWPREGVALGMAVPAAVVAGGLVANLIENLGWRSWLQRGLQARMSPLSASTAVGVVWGLWHLPLLFVDGTAQSDAGLSPTTYLPLLVALSVALGTLYNASRGSVLPVVVAHTSFNVTIMFALVSATPAAANLLLVVLTGLFGLTAAASPRRGPRQPPSGAVARVPGAGRRSAAVGADAQAAAARS